MDSKSLPHVKWKCQVCFANFYHNSIFIPKYRKKVLYGHVKVDICEIIKTVCRYKNVEIMDEAVCEDHVHLRVVISSKYSISNFMEYLKRKSTLMIYDRHPYLQNKWDKAFWARG